MMGIVAANDFDSCSGDNANAMTVDNVRSNVHRSLGSQPAKRMTDTAKWVHSHAGLKKSARVLFCLISAL